MPIRVVLADDQALIRSGFKMILEAQPDIAVVGEAQDGREAVELGLSMRPDVMVMDIRMPRMNGIEATRLLAGSDAADPIKVLILTTFDLDEYVYDALRAGASGFLVKDRPPEEFVAAVRVVAGGEALLAPSITKRLIRDFASRRDPQKPPDALVSLTAREQETLMLIAKGLSNAEIGAQLFLSEATVKSHVSKILMKLGLRDRVQAVVLAYETGLVQPGDASS